jgi:UDP-N-acetylglucosamine--N-acetylmuramyl-(pentapeptide) pyrophosphoryl-undecaprenol N-acetylglucosamine transferase
MLRLTTTEAFRPRASTLLVASAGGHLAQLHQLRPRLEGIGDDVTWVTFDTPQARSLLAGEQVVWARYTAPRDLPAVVANSALAARDLARLRPAQVVSTGSAIALSFLPLAQATGASSHYIESATRVDGPSATGRLLARVPGIHLYTQHAGWADGRWHHAGNVFDGYQARPRRPRPVGKVVVALGTMRTYGFRRLLDRLVEVLPAGVEVLWQTGCTDVAGLGIQAREAVPAAELHQAMREADLVVTHAGTGSALAALEAGKLPILVPRSGALGEHIDEHQHQTAAELASRRLAIAVEVDALGPANLVMAASLGVERRTDPPPILLAATRLPLTSGRPAA